MNKTELEEAIKNGESVWVVSLENVWEIKPTIKDLQILPTFKDIYKTKAEAEHYLYHANVTRVEHLPFLTWEEFTSDIMAFNSFSFMSDDDFKCSLFYDKENDLIILDKGYGN